MPTRAIAAMLAILLAFGAGARGAGADEEAAWAALRAGGHVALMRHTDAPGGTGDPPGFKLGDCSTQRNLSAKGRDDAGQIGARLKAENIAIDKILSSPWCRCVDTANLLELGPVQTESTFGNVVVLTEQRDALTEGGREVITAWTGKGALLIVTHGANIRALTGVSPSTGEIVVVKTGADGSIAPVGRIPPLDR
jgi:phosphohistidine phosphatase SixA